MRSISRRRRVTATVVAGAWTILVVAGCGNGTSNESAHVTNPTGPSATTMTTATTTVSISTTSTEAVTPPTEGRTSVVEQGQVDLSLHESINSAIGDLAGRLSITADDVTVISAAHVEWPDQSLGCPAPGMLYAQVIVDGALIELAANGTVHRYHSGASRGPFLCERTLEDGQLPLPGP